MNGLKDRIKARLAELGWTISDLAREASLPRQTVHNLLGSGVRQTKHLQVETLQRIAAALKTSMDQLTTGLPAPILDAERLERAIEQVFREHQGESAEAMAIRTQEIYERNT